MTNELQKTGDETEPGFLLERPQRLGFLPSWWFWNQKENWRLIRLPMVLLVLVVFVALELVSLPPLLGAVTVAVTLTLALGLAERYVRQKALTRRAMPEPRSTAHNERAVGERESEANADWKI